MVFFKKKKSVSELESEIAKEKNLLDQEEKQRKLTQELRSMKFQRSGLGRAYIGLQSAYGDSSKQKKGKSIYKKLNDSAFIQGGLRFSKGVGDVFGSNDMFKIGSPFEQPRRRRRK